MRRQPAYLAAQLLLPLALAWGGTFRNVPLSRHASTNIDVIQQFLGTSIEVARSGDDVVGVAIRP